MLRSLSVSPKVYHSRDPSPKRVGSSAGQLRSCTLPPVRGDPGQLKKDRKLSKEPWAPPPSPAARGTLVVKPGKLRPIVKPMTLRPRHRKCLQKVETPTTYNSHNFVVTQSPRSAKSYTELEKPNWAASLNKDIDSPDSASSHNMEVYFKRCTAIKRKKPQNEANIEMVEMGPSLGVPRIEHHVKFDGTAKDPPVHRKLPATPGTPMTNPRNRLLPITPGTSMNRNLLMPPNFSGPAVHRGSPRTPQMNKDSNLSPARVHQRSVPFAPATRPMPPRQLFLVKTNNNSKPNFDPADQIEAVWEVGRTISNHVKVDGYRLFCVDQDMTSIKTISRTIIPKVGSKEPMHRLVDASENEAKMVLRALKRDTVWALERTMAREFPPTPPLLVRHYHHRQNRPNFVLYVPIKNMSPNGINYVIELWRFKPHFSHGDISNLRHVRKMASTVVDYSGLYGSLLQEAQMSDFLLHVVQAVFEEMVSLEQLIKTILESAQRLVHADRASLFLVDYRNSELVSTVFDLRYDPVQDLDMEKKEIRIPIDKGIAGFVATSGETMNIPDAYADPRFNKAVDEATGYRTVSILCMPIKVKGKVIAVVQMVNKRNKEKFESTDEAAFKVFSTYFGLALHHARLYDKIKRKEQKYRVAMEVLSYHNTCSEEDVASILNDRKNEVVKLNYNDFRLNPFEVDEMEKCKAVLTMFDDLFDLSKFDVRILTRFVLTVKKNYRKVPYHNFDHGWSVAHAMYVMIRHDTENRLDYKTRLALFIACLCHDLDHRGYTNKYMSEIESPLAAMYTTSTLEHHHFNITVTILQQDGHNIFVHLSGEEYKDMLGLIRQCILATDLANFFPNLRTMNELIFESDHFDWTDETHRSMCRAIAMTSADLSAAAKPFLVQLQTVDIIFTEFYYQGDLERAIGKTPIPTMDRNKPEEQASSQVGFLSQICVPCYKVLQQLLPETKPMFDMATINLENWKALSEKAIDAKSESEKLESQSDDGNVSNDVSSEVVNDDVNALKVVNSDSDDDDVVEASSK